MSKWIDAVIDELQITASYVARNKDISEGAVEKDWWVTAILKVLFSLSPAKYMFFKGGTSLSKGWNLIDRFSEDIDIALYRDFYLDVLGKECANASTNNQVKNLRIANRDYILGEFADELIVKLDEVGLGECRVVPITTKKDGSPIDHDSDPVIIEIHYPVKVSSDAYVRPVVKIEISCLSMKEPYEVKRISSLVGEAFSQIDDETFADIPTITPTRTFLEKAFLLNEEYQRKNPRTERMSRHLYDLERLMDTPFAEAALSDMELYQEIIAHRQRFYHVGGVTYELNHPSTIKFCQTGDLRDKMRLDYDAMKTSMIYGEKLSFETLIARLEQLQERFKSI
ncbi:MAG: nucleotidyl transferase AbiEii/AbiGii toxin family protein [Candidatus Amulumruptor sp.]